MQMTTLRPRLRWQCLIGLAVIASAGAALAQSADALIDKLVDKGILSVKEANELREESEKNFNQAYQIKTGMPDWVTSLKFSGDVRVRYEGFYSDAAWTTNGFVDRNRFRYRLRFGAAVTMLDNFEAGFRLTSSDAVSGGVEGDPISGNTTFQNNASKKMFYVDQAYGRWYALKGGDLTGTLTVGKMENPLVFDDMVFDADYTPEGAALQMGYSLDNHHRLKLNCAGFVLDELASASPDPYMLAGQLRWDAAWSGKVSSTLGLSGLSIQQVNALVNSAVPNVNRGNTRSASTAPTYGFNPWVVDGAITFNVDRTPLYRGAFPVKVSGEYLQNPAAPSGADNYAWNAGVVFGKASKKGTWEFSYTYKWLGANAWYEEVEDSDFGAFYGQNNAPPNSGFNYGYGAGTDVKGHILRFAYSPADSVLLSVKAFLTDLIRAFPGGSDSHMNRLQVDANWKF
jgi:hypothetical protein